MELTIPMRWWLWKNNENKETQETQGEKGTTELKLTTHNYNVIFISKYMYIYLYIYIIYIPSYVYISTTLLFYMATVQKKTALFIVSQSVLLWKNAEHSRQDHCQGGAQRKVYNINNSCWCTQHSRAHTHTDTHTLARKFDPIPLQNTKYGWPLTK